MTFFQCGLCPKKKSAILLISLIHSTPRSNSRTKCHQKKLFSLILKFSKDHGSLTAKLQMFKRITSLQKRFNIRTSLQVTLSVLRRVLLKEKLYVYCKQTWLRNFRVTKARISDSFTQVRLPEGTCRKYLSQSKILITK